MVSVKTWGAAVLAVVVVIDEAFGTQLGRFIEGGIADAAAVLMAVLVFMAEKK